MSVLTLRVRRAAAGFSVSLWKGSRKLTDEDTLTSDLSTTDLDAIRKELTAGRTLTQKIPRIASLLGAALLPPPVLEKWKQESRATPANERLVTILDVDKSLQSYPWEIARAETRLFLQPERPFVRKAATTPLPFGKPEWPIDMLIVLGSSARELRAIDGYAELQRIRDVLRERNRYVHLHILDLSTPDPKQPGATGRQRVTHALTTIMPQVFHFIGHGTDNGLQLFQVAADVQKRDPGNSVWTKDSIAADLTFTPWLVYLNACRSVGGGQVAPEQFNTLATAFFDKGARAVVAMHADISGSSAAICAEHFYKTLASGKPVDAALAYARAEVDRAIVGSEAGEQEMAEAYLPTLTIAGDPDETIPCLIDLSQPPELVKIGKGDEIRQVVNELVNRDRGRRDLLGWPLPGSGDPKAIAISGPRNSGKSWLLAWCMDGWMRREYAVRYHPMAGHKNWFDAMAGILRGEPAAGENGVPLTKALDVFVAEMGSLLAPVAARSWGKKTGTLKLANRSRLNSKIDFVGACFAKALEQAAGDKPLVIVLDQFEMPGIVSLDPVTFKMLYTHWIKPHVLDKPGLVRVILGLGESLPATYELPQSLLKVSLDAFPQQYYAELMDELLRARYAKQFAAVKHVWEAERQTYPAAALLPSDLSEECNEIYKALWIKAGRPTT